MNCPCGVDHWSHLAAGFQGIVSMMGALNTNNVPCSDAGFAKMESEMKRLQEQIDTQREKRKQGA